jgi:hypothetical protein
MAASFGISPLTNLATKAIWRKKLRAFRSAVPGTDHDPPFALSRESSLKRIDEGRGPPSNHLEAHSPHNQTNADLGRTPLDLAIRKNVPAILDEDSS